MSPFFFTFRSALSCVLVTILSTTGLSGFDFSSAGFRLGLDDEDGDNFTGYEAFGTSKPFWSWDLSERNTLSTTLETAAGVIRGNSDTAGYVRFGAAAHLSLGKLPLSVTINTGIQVLTEDTFGDFDLGGNFNFSSGVGVDWDLSKDWVVAYRFQHTSNASLYDANPGLDLHSFSIAYKF
ncbi:MAG: acyloxyacyl hydrolase [Verrucomicrobiota bacterium]